jgi:hypothetical protein
MGPIQTIGKLLKTVGTLVDVVDNTVSRSAKLINLGFDAIEIPSKNMLADLQCDSIVDDAKRDARMATAQAEAKLIRESVATPRTTTSTTKEA